MARSSIVARCALALFGAASFTAIVACGGFSEEAAIERCDQEQAARGAEACFTDTTYDECLAAYEDCGSDVQVGESCPLRYTCPE